MIDAASRRMIRCFPDLKGELCEGDFLFAYHVDAAVRRWLWAKRDAMPDPRLMRERCCSVLFRVVNSEAPGAPVHAYARAVLGDRVRVGSGEEVSLDELVRRVRADDCVALSALRRN